jgi:hypothetical protein
MAGKASRKSAKVAKKTAAKRAGAKAAKPRKTARKSQSGKAAKPALVAGGNPQIARADGHVQVEKMAHVAAVQQNPKVTFRLCCFSNENALGLLPPEGTMVMQYLQFPIDFDDCTCIPTGEVGYWSRAGVTYDLERQWYRQREPLERKDIPADLTGSPRVKKHVCHRRRPDPNGYPLSQLTVDDQEVQMAAFLGNKLLFRRLGQEVVLDLQSVPKTQPFALAVEWSPTHIEARVTWVEGDGMERYYSGVGVPYEQFATYKHPGVGKVVQFRERREFDALLIPAAIARAIWRSAEASIDEPKHPEQRSPDVAVVRKSYADQQDFLRTVIEVIAEVRRAVLRAKPHPFWNKKVPKREPDAGSGLRMLFEAICAYKNIQVFQEDPSRSGNVDLVFTGISIAWKHLSVVLEIKNAHSDRVEHGLTVQLPTYLLEREVPTGIYGILWYKGTHFDQPNDATIEDCIARLDAKKPAGVVSVVGFDLSFSVQASKKQHL